MIKKHKFIWVDMTKISNKISYLNKSLSTLFLSWYKVSYFRSDETTVYRRPMRAVWKLWRKWNPDLYFMVDFASKGSLIVREGDIIQYFIIFEGDYEPEVWNVLDKYLVDKDVLWDVGANIGTITVKAIHDCRIRCIYSFEPQPRVLDQLEENIRINRGDSVNLVNQALGDRQKTMKLYLSPTENTGKTSLSRDMNNGYVNIVMTTIDTLVYEKGLLPPTVIKMDVEGWEVNVLKGARRLLETAPPRIIIFEDQIDEVERLPHTKELKNLLQEYHYKIEHIPRKTGEFEVAENFIALQKKSNSNEK